MVEQPSSLNSTLQTPAEGGSDPAFSPRLGRSPNYGGRLGYGIFHILIRAFGVIPAYALLALIVPWYVLVRGSARRSAAHYLRRRFSGRSAAWRFFASFFYFFKFGQVLIDQAAVGILGKKAFRVEFPQENDLYARARKGLILLASHIGNWQTAMADMRALDVPVHFQFRREAHTEGRHFFDLADQKGDFRMVNPDGFLGGMVEMTNALRKGECVSVMGDRAWGGRTACVDFLGRPAHFPIAAYHLALTTGAGLAMLLTARTGRLRYRIQCLFLTDGLDASLRREARTAELLHRYVRELERYLDKHPFMWFNFFDFWAEGKETLE